VLAGRRASEASTRAALDGLGVFAERRPQYLDDEQAALRNGLRAKCRQLGGDHDLLIAECAYEQWHRLLFARFLAENKLLLHPQFRAPVTLEDCEDLAVELGEPDGWAVAARFAAEILPGIFRLDDPCFRLRLAPEGRFALEEVLIGLSAEVFVTDDALGWVYQFWQKDKKDEINASERKIGGADLGPVTQLFTENYMVRFLLENSLGAWWASRHPDSPLVKGFDYLRLDQDREPAAGSFDGWPEHVAEVTVMDPCCGSGHFLVEAFSMLWQMRAEEEGLSHVHAQDAVLRDNLFGLELDSRCVQIAMFALALQAWKAGGAWRPLPIPNLACSGLPVKAPVEEWKAVAGGDLRLENALSRLHTLFSDADSLGSLINPRQATDMTGVSKRQLTFEAADWDEVAPLLERAMTEEANDPATAVIGADAVSVARAADFLARKYSLVVTNVPYLKRSRQAATLASYCADAHPDARHDLALALLDRFGPNSSTVACVLPHGWLFMSWNRQFRERWLKQYTWNLLAHLGAGAFTSISGEVVNVILGIWTAVPPSATTTMTALDIDAVRRVDAKIDALKGAPLIRLRQADQLKNPDAKVILEVIAAHPLLAELAGGFAGIQSGDYPRFGRVFWEVPLPREGWTFQQSTVRKTALYAGREHIFYWQDGRGEFLDFVRERLGAGKEGAWIRGTNFAERRGVAVSSMSSLAVTLYTGEIFDNNTAVILPDREADLAAIWAFAASPEFEESVRRIDTSIKVTNSTFVKVPFDVERWRRIADGSGPLLEPWSDDPTQWPFEGRPEVSSAPCHAAVGRLLGYRWPHQSEQDDLGAFADADGIVCLTSVSGEATAADRLQQLLVVAFGDAWSPLKAKELLEQAGSKKKNLDEWLRDEFFKQHCALFENRPFIWQIWDGLRDGFSTLVNYHRLNRQTLEKLTYTYLGKDWVERQRAGVRDDVPGSEARLAAALELQRKLETILEGEKPFDIYVRWKELHEQPVGWEPDLNDGVRLNIRPFVEAGVLRAPFNIHWKKDRGKNPDGTERNNDIHISLAEKLDARGKAGRP
jgi:hypothetical protein